MDLLSFDDALKKSKHYKKRHLLLGNGFSIACRQNIFRYDKLFEQADFTSLPQSIRKAFDRLGTTDFEYVIKSLRDSAKIIPAYNNDPLMAKQMLDDAENIKELLVETIAKSHPERPTDIKEEEYIACQKFLSNFNYIYTFNYDLLLYWTIMHNSQGQKPSWEDGFSNSYSDILNQETSDYVVWESSNTHNNKNKIWFLHGALHIFDSVTEIKKYTWNRTDRRLIEQIRDSLNNDLFPLFVAEGSSSEKLEKIRHSDYLNKAYRSFEALQKCLFIYGHSLAENDEHYLQLIERGKIEHIFVGLRGAINSEKNKHKVERTKLMSERRKEHSKNKKIPLKIDFVDMSTMKVWQ
ncbi:MAG: DUF4917 family protein [Cyanobacteria bacterium P01_G01_bin.39]